MIFKIIQKNRGLEWDISSHFPNSKLKDLILDVYEKASLKKMWWLVRHSAGMLGMKSDELAKVILKRFLLNQFNKNYPLFKGCVNFNC